MKNGKSNKKKNGTKKRKRNDKVDGRDELKP